MVQFTNIQEQRRPSFGQRVMGAIGSMSQAQQEQAQQAALSQKLNQLTGMDISGLPPELQKVALGEALKSQGKERLLGQKQGMLNELYGSSQRNQQRDMGKDLMGEGSQDQPQGGFQAKNITDEQIARHALIDPEGARIMQHEKDVGLREAREETKASQKKISEARKETLPVRKEFADKAKYARQGIENKKSMKSLLATNKISDPLTVEISKYLPGAIGNRLLSPETQVYKSALFDEFGVLRNIFSGQTRVKEIELLEDKLATLDKSNEAKEAILDLGIKKLEKDVILADSAAKIEKTNPGASLLEFEDLTQKDAAPKLEKLFNQILDGYDEIYFKYAPPKSSYVDQNGNRYNNVPKKDLKELFKEAKAQGIDLRPEK